MKLTLEEVMKIRHSGQYFDNGGVFFDVSNVKFYRVNDIIGKNWMGFDKGKPLPLNEWEEIEIMEDKK